MLLASVEDISPIGDTIPLTIIIVKITINAGVKNLPIVSIIEERFKTKNKFIINNDKKIN